MISKNTKNNVPSGAIFEQPITDGFVNGVISAVCPAGYFGFIAANEDQKYIIFSTDPESMNADQCIFITSDIKECVNIELEGEKLSDITDTAGRVWKCVLDEEGNTMIGTHIGGTGVSVAMAGITITDVDMVNLLSSITLTFETEESNLNICEGKDADFFEIRSMICPIGTVVRESLIDLEVDWCILFRKDGTVSAKFDKAVNCKWGAGFNQHVATGVWEAGVITFTGGSETKVMEYALDGDRLSLFLNEYPLVFQRSNATLPDFTALNNAPGNAINLMAMKIVLDN